MDSVDLDDLVRSSVAGDERAFTDLYRHLQPMLLRYLRVMTGQAAEDLCSETWAAVVPRLGDFSGEGRAFTAWLFTVGRSKVVDRVRYESRRPADPRDDLEVLGRADPQDVAREVLDALSTEAALRLVATLPPDQAEIVSLRVLGGLDTAEVARITGKSAGAVRVAQHRALKRLASLLSEARPVTR